ncbi:MAG: ABC transporter substrate-binding protein [Firmicutes bacterium]|nr:ABC transporter substrate-binding protein [Bacillota bacterium]
MKKYLALLMVLVLSLGVLSGCGGGSGSGDGGSSSGKTQKDRIIIVTEEEPAHLGPRQNSVAQGLPSGLIYGSLIRYEDDDASFYGDLATEWEWLDDLHLKFKLREGVKFSNGEDFTAEDVLFSFAQTKTDSTAISTMAWYDDVNSYAPSDYEVVLAFNYPYYPAMQVCCGGRTWIADKTTYEKVGEDEYKLNPVGTGPYVLDSWTTGSNLVLKRNDSYWGEPAKTEYLEMQFISEATSRVIALETGEADISYYINGNDADRVDALDGYHIERGRAYKYYTVVLNMQNPKFADKRVREALCLALDLDALTDATFDGQATTMVCAIPSKTEGATPIYGGGTGKWEYNPEKAKQLVKEAGVEGMEFELHIASGGEFKTAAEAVQGYWEAIGFKVNIETSALASREPKASGKPWEASIRSGNASEVTSILIIYDSAFGSRVGNNDDYLDSLLDQLEQCYDTAKRKELIKTTLQYIYDIKYTMPFAEVDSIYGVSDKLENYKFKPGISLWGQNAVNWVVYEE